ncbi:MAG: hypothetical protein MZV63_37465 [Marinilabiliales bacterium]|nr:hypothetical protein [Marinilabiliales bacterium]
MTATLRGAKKERTAGLRSVVAAAEVPEQLDGSVQIVLGQPEHHAGLVALLAGGEVGELDVRDRTGPGDGPGRRPCPRRLTTSASSTSEAQEADGVAPERHPGRRQVVHHQAHHAVLGLGGGAHGQDVHAAGEEQVAHLGELAGLVLQEQGQLRLSRVHGSP